MNDAKPVLKPDVVYIADNGRLICVHCAGLTALYTGRDISGHTVEPITEALGLRAWIEEFGSCTCEEGCTTITLDRGEPVVTVKSWRNAAA